MSKRLTLWHVTTDYALPCIVRRGILTRLAIGRIRAVWLATTLGVDAALRHCCSRHRVELDQTRCIEVFPDRRYLQQWSDCGVYYSHVDIRPGQFGRILTMEDFVAVPAHLSGIDLLEASKIPGGQPILRPRP